MRAFQVTRFGGPEELELVELPDPEPRTGQFVIDVETIGINYADTHQIENTYLSPTTLPFIPGAEVAGHDGQGRRWVGFTDSGGYAERALLNQMSAIPIPDGVSNEAALACLVQGLTAWHLLKTSTLLKKGESMLVLAGAGGVGNLLMQLGRHFEAGLIIGVVSSDQKVELLNSQGFEDAILASPSTLHQEVLRLTDARGVDTCFEMVGGSMADQSLRCLAPFGRMAVYGMASREPMSAVSPANLMVGSKSLIGFWLVDLMRYRPEVVGQSLKALLDLVSGNVISPITSARYRLEDAALAHKDLLARKTIGKVTLQVDR